MLEIDDILVGRNRASAVKLRIVAHDRIPLFREGTENRHLICDSALKGIVLLEAHLVVPSRLAALPSDEAVDQDARHVPADLIDPMEIGLVKYLPSFGLPFEQLRRSIDETNLVLIPQ